MTGTAVRHSVTSNHPTRQARRRRVWAGLAAAALLLTACSGDDGDTGTTEPDTTEPGTTPPDTSDTDTDTTEPDLTGDGLAVSVLAPAPGLLANLFPAQQRGIALAADDIAAAGGVLEGPLAVTNVPTELGRTEAQNVRGAVQDGARALIGPAGSTSAALVRPELSRNNTIACSASATLPGLTAGQEEPFLFRTAISDEVTIAYMAERLAERQEDADSDEPWNVAVVARLDDYGIAVGAGLANSLIARGMEAELVGYHPRRVIFDDTADEVAALEPDVTILVSYEEGPRLLAALLDEGLDPTTMLGLDGFLVPRLASITTGVGNESALDGFTVLASVGDNAFLQRLFADDPNGQVAFAAQAYDCAVVLALAAEDMASAQSTTLMLAIQRVTGGGRTCTTYADCLEKLQAGEDIDYDGPSGRLAIDDDGDPTFARFTAARLADGEFAELTSTDVDVAELRTQIETTAAAAFNATLQAALAYLGFFEGEIDGVYTPELSAAVAAFQESVGLPATGVFDAATDQALRAALGDDAESFSWSVVEMQVAMTELGFYDGPIDGIWNDELTDSIIALQRELGVPETGILDARTLRAVYERGLEDGAPATTTTSTTTSTTAAPATTAPPATRPPTTAPPATRPPTTPPPATRPPTTPAPTTRPPTTPAPTTAPPTTPAPTTAPPESVPPESVPPETLPPDADLDKLWPTLQADPQFATFVDLVTRGGFTADIDEFARFTVFAPTNAAFADIDPARLEEVLADRDLMEQILAFHIVEGEVRAADLPRRLETIGGWDLRIAIADSSVTVEDSTVTQADILATNGVIHAIDAVMIPPLPR
jgi:ABC-type branched-subunit amino acid transport system substrate-binding protein/peptidoglycan hydrolase-like protein with peptidoglycan-binding domain